MARHISLLPRKFQIKLRESSKASLHGGQLVILGLLQQSGFLERIAELPALDPRKDRNRGFDREVYLAAVLFSFCTGGTSLSDVEELGKDCAFMKLLGKTFGLSLSRMAWICFSKGLAMMARAA